MAEFRGINTAGFLGGKKKDTQNQPKKRITGVDDYNEEPVEEKLDPEVRLISAKWVPGPKGFDHYDCCYVEVKGEYLQKTIRARLKGRLFGIYDGVEEDLNYEIEGWLSKDTGTARMKIGKLWFVNSDHYNAWYNDKSTEAQYIVKEIFHSRGQNTIDSPVLEMPAQSSSPVQTMEWDRSTVHRGEKITAKVTFSSNKYDNNDVSIAIYEYKQDQSHEKVANYSVKVQGSMAQLEWTFDYQKDTNDIATQKDLDDEGKQYEFPRFFFIINIDETEVGGNQESGLLLFKDNIEISLIDSDNNPVPNEAYEIILADGSKVKGQLDDEGKSVVEDVAPGPYKVIFQRVLING